MDVHKSKLLIAVMVVCSAFAALLCFTMVAHGEPAGTYIYVSNYYSDSITVIDATTFQRAADIKTDRNPSDVIVNPAGTYLYVAYDGAPYVDVFSTVDYSRTARIRVSDNDSGYQYTRMSMNDQGTRLYVTMYGDFSLYEVDIVNKEVIAQKCYEEAPGVGTGPFGVLYYNGYVYVSLYSASIVHKLNADTLSIVESYVFPTVEQPTQIVLDSKNNRLLINNINETVSVLNLAGGFDGVLNLTKNTNNGALEGIGANSSGYAYHSDYAGNNVTIFKPDKSILTNITGITNAAGLVCNNYNDTVFVAANGAGRLYIIDGATLLGYVDVGTNPYRVAIGTQAAAVQHQVLFVVQSQFGLFKYEDVKVSVYDVDGILKYSEDTDTSGQVAFYLNPTSSYTVIANSTTDNINETMTIYPYDDTYYFKVWSFFVDWNPFGWIQNAVDGWTGTGTGDINKDIRMNYSVDTVSNPRVVLINFTDYTASTIQVNFTLLRWWQENGTYTIYNTTIVAGSGISYQQMPITVPSGVADGQSYTIVVTGTSRTGSYGTVKRQDTIHFPGVAYPLPGLPTDWYPYIAFGVIVLFGLMFTYFSSGLGLLVMAFWGIVFMFMGWLTWNNAFLLLFQVLAVFGAGQIFKMRRQREGV